MGVDVRPALDGRCPEWARPWLERLQHGGEGRPDGTRVELFDALLFAYEEALREHEHDPRLRRWRRAHFQPQRPTAKGTSTDTTDDAWRNYERARHTEEARVLGLWRMREAVRLCDDAYSELFHAFDEVWDTYAGTRWEPSDGSLAEHMGIITRDFERLAAARRARRAA